MGNSEEIFFALMTYGQHGHGLAVLDFKQCDITVRTKTDNQLAQQGMFRRRLAATEWKGAQEFEAFGNRRACAPGGFRIPLREKIEQMLQVPRGGRRKPYHQLKLISAICQGSNR